MIGGKSQEHYQSPAPDAAELQRTRRSSRTNWLDAAFDNLPVPTSIWQHQAGDFKLIDYNPAADAASAGRLVARMGSLAGEFYAQRPDIRADLDRCFAKQTTISRETTFVSSLDNIDHSYQLTYVYLPPDLVMLQFSDVTALAKAERERRRTEEHHRAIIDTLQEAVLVYAMEGQVIDANPSVERVLGLSVAQLNGSVPIAPTWWATHPDGSPFPIAERPSNVVRRTGQPQLGVEMLVHRPDGTTTWVVTNAQPLFRPGESRPYAVCAVMSDITARKRAEEERLAKEKAQAASEAKSQFLSRMSHELRTPLNAILGFAQLLQMDLLDPEQHDMLEQIMNAGRHLLGLINEVLDIARVEEGRMAINREPVELDRLLRESLELIKPLAAERNVGLSNLAGSLGRWQLLADDQRLRQVLINLLSNAVKYNRPGGKVALSYEVREEGLEGWGHGRADDGADAESDAGESLLPTPNSLPPRLRISVSDAGPGIAPEKQGRLFIPFERLGAEQDGVEGTGLGLVMAKLLTEAMGGTIGVKSQPGMGSTFWIDFPLEARDGNGASEHDGAGDEAQPTRTVLYIEDNGLNIKLVELILAQKRDVRLLSADGVQGLALAAALHFDLILLDLELPDISGEEVLRRLRADPHTKGVPVVVISADATPRRVRRLLGAGIRAYITKPLNVVEFLAVVDDALAGPA